MAKLVIVLVLLSIFFQANIVESKSQTGTGTVSLYDDDDSVSNFGGGACGYNIINANKKDGTALSRALFAEGAACGQCYKIICDDDRSKSCIKGSSVTVTTTSFFPTNYNTLFDDRTEPKLGSEHFHIGKSMWKKISSQRGGVVPVLYQRVPCIKQGGVKFTINGKEFFLVVLISNVAGEGSIKSVSIKGSKTKWIKMSRNSGANWHSSVCMDKQSISFIVILTNGQKIEFENVVPANWSFGKTYSSPLQFNSN